MELRSLIVLSSVVAACCGAIVFPDFNVSPANPPDALNTTAVPSTTKNPGPTTLSTPAPTSSSTSVPTSTSSTSTLKPSSTTTIPTSTSPTPAPTSSTPAPTPAPTSSSAAPTPAPTSSSAAPTPAPTSSTPAPTPAPTSSTLDPTSTTTAAPQPDAGEWLVTNSATNVTCLLAHMAFKLNVTYLTSKNTTETIILNPLTVNVNGTGVDGDCGNTTQWISIPVDHGLLTLQFALDSSKSTLTAIELNVTLDEIASVYNETAPLFTTPLKMSYKCSKEETVTLKNANNATADFIFSKVQLQAFRSDNATNFSEAQDCEGPDTPDMVPIAVGASLGVMIVVVLVAYLIGRRRSQSRGYVSM